MAKKGMPLTSDDPKMQKLIEAKWKAINNAGVTVGVHKGAGSYVGGPTVPEVAFWNEFGTSGPNPIPPRPFIAQAVDVNRALLNNLQENLLNDVIDGKKLVIQALRKLGFAIQVAIEEMIDKSSSWAEPNAESTTIQKNRPGGALRGPTPLIRSGLLRRSISFKVVKNL